ncbi:tetratricopeptide repeat protein [Sphingomonas sp. KR1UV-12]|uniref:Tetratricopeptide repeat protein n=1 Tax=Sphingomonas aurea TaxID=3063994 RepID=A0ABT9EN24_9SPHN|nr:tetratricopeptide repeat protein [Sphingomonas sp. KR1UV-12]MDP1028360.1 tetratricopeptide repeat protein [Sphingomonas sp. KR1UV-12]
MALSPESNEAFLREVDDEVRRDQLTDFWKRWGLWVGVAVVAGLAAFGGWLFWQHRQAEVAGQEGEQLQAAYDALANGQAAKAGPMLTDLAGSSRGGYRALAKFSQADVLLRNNDLKAAAAKFAEIAGDTGLAQPFRDLALVRQTAAEFDTLKPQVVVDRLRPLAVPGNPWLGSAGEMVALAQLRLGQRGPAGQMFGQIARDEGVPDSIRQRAVQMASVLGVDAAPANQDKSAQ